jgi:2'-5' RNA ligase
MYTWHFTFDGQPTVHDLAASYQAKLSALPGLDLLPARWLHLTTQGVGFTDKVGDQDVTAIIEASRRRLKQFSPVHVTLGPARVTPEAILLDVSPVAGLAAIRRELRAAISDVWDAGQMMESDQWTPHVSVAYSNTTAPAAEYAAALGEDGETAESLIQAVELIVLGRDEHLYEWTTRAQIALSGGSAPESGEAPR